MIRTQFNFMLKHTDYEHNTKPSKTIPEDCFSIKELYARYRAGMPLTERNGIYTDSEEGLNSDMELNDFDLSDIPTKYEERSRIVVKVFNNDERKNDVRKEDSAVSGSVDDTAKKGSMTDEAGEEIKPE